VAAGIEVIMEESTVSLGGLAATSKHFAQGLLTIGENRLELLAVEVQEGRERLLQAILLALGVAALGLLTGITLTAAIVVMFWAYSPLAVLLTLTALYGAAGGFVWWRLTGLLRSWQAFSASLDQLRKDGECLKKILD
jgi:uncharacterized membrane protein YqjE